MPEGGARRLLPEGGVHCPKAGVVALRQVVSAPYGGVDLLVCCGMGKFVIEVGGRPPYKWGGAVDDAEYFIECDFFFNGANEK